MHSIRMQNSERNVSTATLFLGFQMIFQFGYCSIFFSVFHSRHEYRYQYPSIYLLQSHVPYKRHLSCHESVWKMLVGPGPSSPEHTFFWWLKDSQKITKNTLDVLTIFRSFFTSLWFHWVIEMAPLKDMPLQEHEYSMPLSQSFQRPEDPGWEFGRSPGLQNEKIS